MVVMGNAVQLPTSQLINATNKMDLKFEIAKWQSQMMLNTFETCFTKFLRIVGYFCFIFCCYIFYASWWWWLSWDSFCLLFFRNYLLKILFEPQKPQEINSKNVSSVWLFTFSWKFCVGFVITLLPGYLRFGFTRLDGWG